MAGFIKTLTFAERHDGIPECGVVNLKFAEGDLRAEYVSASELQNEEGAWQYQFLIQEDDLPGGLTSNDVRNANIIEPYWECPDEVVEEEECPARMITCFEDIPVAEAIIEGDEITLARFNEECQQWCLFKFPVADIITDPDALSELQDAIETMEDVTIPAIVAVNETQQTEIDAATAANGTQDTAITGIQGNITTIFDSIITLNAEIAAAMEKAVPVVYRVCANDFELKDAVVHYAGHLPANFTLLGGVVGVAFARPAGTLNINVTVDSIPITTTDPVVFGAGLDIQGGAGVSFGVNAANQPQGGRLEVTTTNTGWIGADPDNYRGLVLSLYGFIQDPPF